MFEEISVNKYVKTDLDRFDYCYRLQAADWSLDSITQQHARQKAHTNPSELRGYTSLP